jgi:hypothetical protein
MIRPIAELVGLVKPSGDHLVRRLEDDLGRVETLEQGWRRLGETAWALGFVNVRLIPDPAHEDVVPRWYSEAPGGGAATRANWAFDVFLGGRRVAVVTMGRGENGLAFDPVGLTGAVQQLVGRFVAPLGS